MNSEQTNSRGVRFVGMILGAYAMLPVSCSLGSAAALLNLASDVRNVAAGDPPHRPFHIIVPERDGGYQLGRLADMQAGSPPAPDFLLAQAAGEVPTRPCCSARFYVEAERGNAQRIRVEFANRDEDVVTMTRYRAAGGRIEPIESAVRHTSAEAPTVIAAGVGTAFLVWLLGRGLRRVPD